MKKLLILSLAVAFVASAAVAQEGDAPCCPQAAKKAETLTSKITTLEAGAKKGCKTSGARLDALVKAANVKDRATLKKHVAAYEQYAPMGCAVSQKALDNLTTLLAKPMKPTRQPLSVRVAALVKAQKAGCEKSSVALKPFYTAAKTECCSSLIAQIETLEKSAGAGCEKSAAQLTTLEAMYPAPRQALSVRVASLVKGQKAGCEKSAAALKPLYTAAETECCDSLIAQIEKLEVSAKAGCEKSSAQLTTLSAKLPALKPVANAKTSTAAESCTDCCPDCCSPAQKAGG